MDHATCPKANFRHGLHLKQLHSASAYGMVGPCDVSLLLPAWHWSHRLSPKHSMPARTVWTSGPSLWAAWLSRFCIGTMTASSALAVAPQTNPFPAVGASAVLLATQSITRISTPAPSCW